MLARMTLAGASALQLSGTNPVLLHPHLALTIVCVLCCFSLTSQNAGGGRMNNHTDLFCVQQSCSAGLFQLRPFVESSLLVIVSYMREMEKESKDESLRA